MKGAAIAVLFLPSLVFADWFDDLQKSPNDGRPHENPSWIERLAPELPRRYKDVPYQLPEIRHSIGKPITGPQKIYKGCRSPLGEWTFCEI